jgi:hypothetical protein
MSAPEPQPPQVPVVQVATQIQRFLDLLRADGIADEDDPGAGTSLDNRL